VISRPQETTLPEQVQVNRRLGLPGGAVVKGAVLQPEENLPLLVDLSHSSASCATRDSGFAPGLCHNRPRPGGPCGDAQLA
jgi:hypothetical protein